MTKPPLTPEQKEDYARRLKTTLKTRRPRKVLRLLLALVALVSAVALIWRLNRPPLVSPPLVLVCFDGVGRVGAPLRTQAWLKIVESPPEKSVGLTVHWHVVGGSGELPTTKSGPQGIAEIELPAPAAESVLTLQASTEEPEQRHDRGRVFVFPPQTKVVIVPIAPLAGEHVLPHDRDVGSDEMKKFAARKAEGWRFVYAASADDPIAYRSVRGWLQRQVERGMPDGPVLRMRVTDGKEIALEVVARTHAEPAILWEP